MSELFRREQSCILARKAYLLFDGSAGHICKNSRRCVFSVGRSQAEASGYSLLGKNDRLTRLPIFEYVHLRQTLLTEIRF